jgi:fructose/tagatose bisphosphate aldolase
MPAKTIIVHDLRNARAALAASADLGVPVLVRSAPDAAAYLGPSLFKAIIDQAAAEHPGARFTAVLDCGDQPGTALNALRHGVKAVAFSGPRAVREKIADIAAKCGATVTADETSALDLLEVDDAEAACRSWLAEDGDEKAG